MTIALHIFTYIEMPEIMKRFTEEKEAFAANYYAIKERRMENESQLDAARKKLFSNRFGGGYRSGGGGRGGYRGGGSGGALDYV